MLFSQEIKNEQVSKETPENLQLIALAKDRANNGRKGDRALQQLIEQQRRNLNSAIRKRLVDLPFLDAEELEFACLEQIVNRVDSFDPLRGQKFSSWAYYGILCGIDHVVRNELKSHKAKLEAQYSLPAYTETDAGDPVFLEQIFETIADLSEEVQRIIELVIEGYRYTEIGEMLGKTADAVRMTYNRGIKRIQRLLNPQSAEAKPEPAPQPEPKERKVRTWPKTIFSWVVRFGRQSRKEICSKQTSPRETTISMNTTTPRRPEHGKIPLAYFQTEAGQKRYQALTRINLTNRGKLFLMFLSGVALFLLLHQPASAQCAGWLCGGRDAILENEMWGADTPDADIIVNGIFLALQFVAALLIAVPLLLAAALGIRREDYTPYFIGSAIIFMALIAINFMVGWLFGV